MSKWVDWFGGDMPVDGETVVDVKFRDGDQHIGDGGEASIYHWHHYAQNADHPVNFYEGADIIAYRVVPA